MSVFAGILPSGDDSTAAKIVTISAPPVGDSAPPIEDPKVCFPLPPPVGNWHLNAVNGVVQSETWVAD